VIDNLIHSITKINTFLLSCHRNFPVEMSEDEQLRYMLVCIVVIHCKTNCA
jgi:L-ribulose-5-phosphate 3-epimerase UlaE